MSLRKRDVDVTAILMGNLQKRFTIVKLNEINQCKKNFFKFFLLLFSSVLKKNAIKEHEPSLFRDNKYCFESQYLIYD